MRNGPPLCDIWGYLDNTKTCYVQLWVWVFWFYGCCFFYFFISCLGSLIWWKYICPHRVNKRLTHTELCLWIISDCVHRKLLLICNINIWICCLFSTVCLITAAFLSYFFPHFMPGVSCVFVFLHFLSVPSRADCSNPVFNLSLPWTVSRAPSGKVCRDTELLEIVHKEPIMSARESHGQGPGVETKDGATVHMR